MGQHREIAAVAHKLAVLRLAGLCPGAFVKELAQAVGCAAEVALPLLGPGVTCPFGGIEVANHPLPLRVVID